ncbi:formate dehydrogenase accessory sulfurtransferase FdhD [Neptuniibacter caesariensis]|uniref:Sulfur carrier protein FdhD n=1 Tax=Neptuniibacter caesariensis TaxID=207954 RepID=A0A7U8C2C3_NEPCE|nr:formate dehydrogenase accessory sulfurtransferase FdhD [Neptuniibacter caesariensis]EAR60210.1 Formate dehydrogenase, subunit FdhD [Oceanospirillum sp. MED92] [Neptuniibacter caesariensis]
MQKMCSQSKSHAIETPVSIAINGIAHAVMMVTPTNLKYYAAGFAFAEGIVDHIEQIRDITIREDSHQINSAEQDLKVKSLIVDLRISPRQFHEYKKRQSFRRGLTSCGLCGSAAISEALPGINPLHETKIPTSDLLINAHKNIKSSAGLHTAQLIDPSGTILTTQEDIGRHNALDKVLGFALFEQLKLSQHFVILTSRCSVELVQKAARAGLSTLVNLSSPSNLAIDMAQHYKLNLIQVTRSGEIRVYTHSNSLGGEL